MPLKKQTKRCPNGYRRNASSGECKPNKVESKSNTKNKCATVSCPETKICNPASGKCVLKTGAIGRIILQKTNNSKTNSETAERCIRCPKNKIFNPASGKCVLRTGSIGLKLVEIEKKVEQKLRELERTSDVPESIKKHVKELGSDDPKIREKAMHILQKAGEKSAEVAKFIRDYRHIILLGMFTLAVYFGYSAGMAAFAGRVGDSLTSAGGAFFGAPFRAITSGCSKFTATRWRALKSFQDMGIAQDYQQYVADLKKLQQTTDGGQISNLLVKVKQGFRNDPTLCKPGSQAGSLLQRFIDLVREKIKNKEDADFWTSYLREIIIKCPIRPLGGA